MPERERFAGLKFRVDKVYDRPLDVVFPELFRHSEFKMLKVRSATWETIVKYIAMLYDANTDLIHEHPTDLKARKEAAAVEAGFKRDPKDGRFSAECEDIMGIKLKDVFQAIMCYLKIQRHHVWTEIVVCEQELYEYQMLRFMAIDTGTKKKTRRRKGETEQPAEQKQSVSDKDIYEAAKKKDALLEASDKRRKALEQLYKEFYGDHKDVEKAEFAEMILPETAERIMKAEAPVYQEITAAVDVPA